MERKNYKNNVWYPLTDEEFWVEDYPEQFPRCHTIVCCLNEDICSTPLTMNSVFMSWGTMAKSGEWMFMIIGPPNETIQQVDSKES